jgi:hypothetical protein
MALLVDEEIEEGQKGGLRMFPRENRPPIVDGLFFSKIDHAGTVGAYGFPSLEI